MEMNGFISIKRLIVFIGLLSVFAVTLTVKYGKQMLTGIPAEKAVISRYERGKIADRNGKMLAVATTLYNLSLNKTVATDLNIIAAALSPIIDIPEKALLEKMQKSVSSFLYLKKKLSESEKNLVKETIADRQLTGLRLEPISNRTYPENDLASTLIGYLGDDGKGLSGIEYSMQNILSPSKGIKQGYTVFLTIDSTMQYLLQKIAEKTKAKTQAEAVIFLAVDANTGEILAYVNEPSADLAHYPDSTVEERFDRPAYFMYEPGSVFKIFSLASLLDIGAVRDSDALQCDAKFLFMPHSGSGMQNSIRCLRPHGIVHPRDIIRFSCNDGMAQIADNGNSNAFAEKLKAFGFGFKTGIELPGEATGLFAPVAEWSRRTKHTIAIGQEIAVTSLQIMQAATAFTNNGETVKLSVLSQIQDAEGNCVYRHKRAPIRQVIAPKTAHLLLDYMQTAADEGTGARASINGVSIAVKTGTAQMAAPGEKGYSSTDYLSSCIGIFPVEDPKIILYTAIIRPVGETYGSRLAAPTISEAANAIIDYRGMGRANAPNVSHTGIIQAYHEKPITVDATMPNLIGTPKRLLLDLLIRKDIVVKITGDGYVVRQEPPAGTPVSQGMIIELTLN